MNLPLTLTYLRPGEAWILDGDTMDGLIWLADTTRPTPAEVAAAATAAAAAAAAARDAAIAHAKSLGFTDAMIAVMYPNLVEA